MKESNYDKVSYIKFVRNAIEEIDTKIFNCKKLQILELGHNKIYKIPNEIINFNNLKILKLSQNKIEEIPKEIYNLTQLEILEIKENPIKELSKDIKNLTKLRKIDLSFTGITEFPDELFELPKLRIILYHRNVINENCMLIYNYDYKKHKLEDSIKYVYFDHCVYADVDNLPNYVEIIFMYVLKNMKLNNFSPSLRKLVVLNEKVYSENDLKLPYDCELIL